MSREKADKEEKKGFKREALSWVICIVVTILLTEFILNFVIINANIPSGSMENTIMTNDKLIALRTSYHTEPEHEPESLQTSSRFHRHIALWAHIPTEKLSSHDCTRQHCRQ